jgi:hypothetical protein
MTHRPHHPPLTRPFQVVEVTQAVAVHPQISDMKVKVIVYALTDVAGHVTTSVVGDHTDNICFGGIGNDGKYHQYDSYEGFHSYAWAEKLGMRVDCYENATQRRMSRQSTPGPQSEVDFEDTTVQGVTCGGPPMNAKARWWTWAN